MKNLKNWGWFIEEKEIMELEKQFDENEQEVWKTIQIIDEAEEKNQE